MDLHLRSCAEGIPAELFPSVPSGDVWSERRRMKLFLKERGRCCCALFIYGGRCWERSSSGRVRVEATDFWLTLVHCRLQRGHFPPHRRCSLDIFSLDIFSIFSQLMSQKQTGPANARPNKMARERMCARSPTHSKV